MTDISLLLWQDNTLGALFSAAVNEDKADEILLLLKERGIDADKIHVPERQDEWVLRVHDRDRFRHEFPELDIPAHQTKPVQIDTTDILNIHRVR